MNVLFKMIAKLFTPGARARTGVKVSKKKGRGSRSRVAGQAHQDLMAQTSGMPMSNGCISPIYSANNPIRSDF